MKRNYLKAARVPAEREKEPGPVKDRALNRLYDEPSPEAVPAPQRGGGAEEGYPARGGSSSGSGNNSGSGSSGTSTGAGTNSGSGHSGVDRDLMSFYTGLAARLRSYGVKDIPSFNELYGLFESFLRPSIEAAISERNRRGRQNMAELDADAYARGMGGSSYLSSVKARERANASADIAALEGKYTSSMAEYLYKAISSMQQMENELVKTRMTLAAQKEQLEAKLDSQAKLQAERLKAQAENAKNKTGKTGRSGKSGKSGKSSKSDEQGAKWGHTSKGAWFDGVWYEGDFSYLKKKYGYNDYANYLESLTPSERYLFFTSSSREWRTRRWQVQYNLPQVDYMDLYSSYMPSMRPGGSSHSGGKGALSWQAHTLS